MAQKFYNFVAEDLGGLPTDFAQIAGASGIEVIADGSTDTGYALELPPTSSSSQNVAIEDGFANADTIKVAMKLYRTAAGSGGQDYSPIRWGGTTSRIDLNCNGAELSSRVDGGTTLFNNAAQRPLADQWWILEAEFTVSDTLTNSASGVGYPATGSSADGTQQTATGFSSPSVGGVFDRRFVVSSFAANKYRVEWIGIGTDGDPAPTAPLSSGPTLDTIPATAHDGQSRTIAVTGAGATQGTGSVTIGGVAQTITAWSDTSITFTTVQSNLKFEAGKTVTLTTDSGDTATGTIELVVEPGTGGFVDVSNPNTTDQSSFAFQVEDAGGNPVATGDQFQWRYTGSPGDPTSMTVGADTLITSVDSDGSVDGRFWDATDSTWGAWQTFSTIDQSPSVTESVTVPTAGTYTAGDTLSFTVNWNEAVTVTGTPAINLNIGGSTRQANYASGTGTTALVFTYTIQSGDEDTDGIAVTNLTLDGGTIQDAAGNNATLTLNSVGDTSGVLVDGVAPVISINPLTTLDTTPIVSGSAGDATSLTLVVNGVTYNPTPSAGSWSQQLPTLALGDYTMTLNGTDAAGNAAVEVQQTLNIVAELPSAAFALIGPAIEPVISNALEDAIG